MNTDYKHKAHDPSSYKNPFEPVKQGDDPQTKDNRYAATDLEARELKANMDRVESNLKAKQVANQVRTQMARNALEVIDFENLDSWELEEIIKRAKSALREKQAQKAEMQARTQAVTSSISTVDGVDFETLKGVAIQILSDCYYRTLVPSSIYKPPKYEEGPDFAIAVLPKSGPELIEFESKVKAIVSHVKNKVETKLNKTVPVENLMKELSNYHDEFIHFMYDKADD